MAVRNPDDVLVATFRLHPKKDEVKSLAAGRPIYEDIEVVDIRAPGSRNWTPQPAHAVAGWVNDPYTGEQRQITYAERFAHQYQQFKREQQQTKSGTPLEHAPFMTPARISELRGLNVYTVEQLAEMDGAELKNLGPGGRDLKNRAQEYIAESKTGAPNLQMQAELDALRAQNQMLQEDNESMKRTSGEGRFFDMTDVQVRDYIQTHTGHAPQGNLNRKTLVRMALEVQPTKAA